MMPTECEKVGSPLKSDAHPLEGLSSGVKPLRPQVRPDKYGTLTPLTPNLKAVNLLSNDFL
jgi:hypothetical protein